MEELGETMMGVGAQILLARLILGPLQGPSDHQRLISTNPEEHRADRPQITDLQEVNILSRSLSWLSQQSHQPQGPGIKPIKMTSAQERH